MGTDLFQQNQAALQSVYPGIAKLIQTISPWTGEIQPKPVPIELNETAELHVLYQVSNSPALYEIDKFISLANLRDNKNRRLLLIEDRVELFRGWLETHDIRNWLQSERCLFLVHNSWQDALQSLLKQYPEISAAPLQVHKGNPMLPNQTCHAIHQTMLDIQTRLIHTFMDYAKSNRNISLPFPKQIRFMTAGHNYLQDACCKAVQAMGYNAKRLHWRDPLYRFIHRVAWIHAHRDTSFDTAFFLNTTPNLFTHGSLYDDLNLRSICWFVDNPKRFVVDDSMDFQNCDGIGVFDKTYIPYLKERCNRPVIEVRTGYGIDHACGDPSLDFSNIDIAFVGELGAKATQTFEESYKMIDPSIVDLSNEILSLVDLNQPFALDELVPGPLQEQCDFEYRGNPVTFFENKAAYWRRKHFLSAIAGEKLRVFGDAEWANPAWSGSASNCYAGKRLDYTVELPRLYATAKINLNIFHPQCVSAPNPRVYDVLACGGFLLSTHNPGLEDEFVIGEDLDVFHSPDELREKIEYYLAHPDERERVAQNGKRKALAKCAYSDRMTLLFSALCAS